MAVWTLYCMYQPYWVRGSKGYLVHIAHIPSLLWNQNRVNNLVWVSVITTNEGSLWQIMISWQFGPCILCTGHIGSEGPRAIYRIKLIYPQLWNEKSRAFIAMFGVPSFPQSWASLWQIMLLLQFGRQTVCTRHIGSVGPRAMWYIKLIYPLLWN